MRLKAIITIQNNLSKKKATGFRFRRLSAALIIVLLAPVFLLGQYRHVRADWSSLSGGIDQYVHDSWSLEQGLQSNSVWAITQTTDGYLWLGTYNGLIRFDGLRFTLFNRDNTDVFRTNTIFSLCPGTDRDLWIGTVDNGLVYYKDGLFKRYTKADGLLDNHILALFRADSGDLWIGSPGGITRWTNNRFVIANPDKEIKDVVSICAGHDQRLWFASRGRGLYSYGNRKFEFVAFPADMSGDRVAGIYSDHQGSIWIGTEYQNIFLFKNNRFSQIKNIQGIPLNGNRACIQDDTEATWIGTDTSLIRISDSNKITRVELDRVRSIFKDRDHNIWVGTYAGGLHRFKKGPVTTLTVKEGLKHNVVYAVYHDRSGTIWIGTKAGGVHRLKDNKLNELKFQKGQQPGDVKCFLEDSRGDIWIGTNNGLFLFADGIVRAYDKKNGLPSNRIRCLHQSLTDPYLIWIGTLDGGLIRFKQGTFEAVPALPRNMAGNIRWIHEDEKKPGVLWIGSLEGLFRLEKDSVSILTMEQGLSSNQLHSFCSGKNGDLWIGTKGGGLNLFRNNRFFSFTTSQGLLYDYIWSILDDNHGNLWMSCDHGIFKIKIKDLEYLLKGKIFKIQPRVFGKSDGMKSNECNGSGNPSARSKVDGKLFFSTQMGLAIIDPALSPSQDNIMPVYIEKVLVENVETDLIRQNTVTAGKRNFEFHFTAVSFSNPDKIQFRYTLEGYDKNWTAPASRRMANYTNLAPGKYRFRVIAADAEGVWNTQGAKITFSLDAYFYETWWFYLSACLILVSLLYTAFRFKVANIKKRNSYLQKEIRERKQAEQEMTHLRNMLRNIIDSMPSVLIGVDKKGYITHWNHEAQMKTGVKTNDACGRLLQEVYPDLKLKIEEIESAIKNKKPHRDEKIPVSENGENFFNNITVYPLVENGVEGAVIRIDDVTELEKKEEQLRQAQKMETVGTLAGGLAHDFNNVLCGILGAFSLLKHKLLHGETISSEKNANLFEIIEISGKRATTMIQQLLTLSRKQQLVFTPVDLNTTLRNVIEICKNSIHKSVKLEPVYWASPALVFADATQMEQVLLNLCINAEHAMTIMRGAGEKWGGRLSISINKITADKYLIKMYPDLKDKYYWLIALKDDGIGMDRETQLKVFNPFFTTKEKGQGTGLGLSIAYNIIKQHNGYINIYSMEKVGTTFNIYLPVLEHAAQPAAQSKNTEGIFKGQGTILVVEDEKIVQRIARDILEECGYSVITADNGQQGVEIFNQKHHDIILVILDMAMPEMSGEEAFGEIVKTDANVKVLLASGFGQDKRIASLLKQGVKTFIEKPYTLEKLSKVVYQIIHSEP
jgi:PAS domain S-box-containing protein